MEMLDRISKVALVLSFYASVENEDGWKQFARSNSFDEDGLMTVIGFIVNKVDEKRVNWEFLIPFLGISLNQFEKEANGSVSE